MFRIALALAFLSATPLGARTGFLEDGRAALGRKDPQTAISFLEKAVAQNPRSADAHYFLGVAYGNVAEKASVLRRASLARRTRDEFEQAVSLDPNHLDARFSLVQYYMIAPEIFGGSEATARQQASEIAKRNAARGHQAFAFIDVRLGDYKQAATELEAAVALDPNDMWTWFEIGHVAALSGLNLQRGEAALQKYLTHTPTDDEPSLDRAFYWLAKIYEHEGRRADAEQARASAQQIEGKRHESNDARGHEW